MHTATTFRLDWQPYWWVDWGFVFVFSRGTVHYPSVSFCVFDSLEMAMGKIWLGQIASDSGTRMKSTFELQRALDDPFIVS